MAHNVMFNIPYRNLGKADVEFEVSKDGERFGKLKVSKGTLVWFPKNHTRGHKVGWTNFDRFMKEQRRSERR